MMAAVTTAVEVTTLVGVICLVYQQQEKRSQREQVHYAELPSRPSAGLYSGATTRRETVQRERTDEWPEKRELSMCLSLHAMGRDLHNHHASSPCPRPCNPTYLLSLLRLSRGCWYCPFILLSLL